MQGGIVGSYKLMDVLGQGSMGDVYLGQHLLFPRQAAIKLIRADRRDGHDLVDRMIREATAASAVDHPSIITVYEAGRTGDGGVYLALEYVDGETLADRMERGRMELADVISLGRQVAEGLAELHARDVLHRDLKPTNLMLTRKGRVKILDFGVALLRRDPAETAGTVAGTPVYMSPEQVRGEPLDGRSDLFSLGIVLYEALTGRRPFQAGNIESVMLRVLHDDPVDPAPLRPDAPDALLTLVGSLLEKDAAQRPADAGEVAARFAEWERVQPAQRRPESATSLAGLPPRDSEVGDERTVIVYPFENQGATAERGYFGDGIAESPLTTALSRRHDLKVVAAAAVRALSRKGRGPLESARQLGAGKVCTGTATWIGERVRVTGQLLGGDGEVIWSRQEDGTEEDFFDLQDQLAQGLIEALRPADETPADAGFDALGQALSPAALRNYQRGVAFLDDTSGFALRRAQETFRQVLEDSPRFTRARAQLALAILKRFLRFDRRPELLQEASREAAEAEQGDPGSALSVAVMALCQCFAGEYAEGLVRAERAIDLDPNLAFAHLVRAHAAGFTGNLPVAREASLEAVQRDPLDPFILHFAALTVSEVPGEEMRGVEWLRRANALSPDHLGSAVKLGEMYLLVHRPADARDAFEKALGNMPAGAGTEGMGHATAMAWDGIAWANVGLGKFAEAQRAAEESIRHGGAEPPVVAHRMLAWARLGLGDKHAAGEAGAEAERRARAYLEMNPHDFQYLMGLGEILTVCGGLREALEPLRESVRRNPGSFLAWGQLARTLACLHDPEALEVAGRMYTEAPLSPEVLYTRYLAMDLLGRAEASSALDEARGLGFAADGWIAVYRALAEAAS